MSLSRRLAPVAALLLAACASLPFTRTEREVWAFTAPWDQRSTESVLRASRDVDVLVTGWIALDSLAGQPRALFTDTVRTGGARRFAIVTSWHGERFHPETVRRLAADPAALAEAADRLAGLSSGTGGGPRYDGIVLDLEGLAPADLNALRLVVARLSEGARRGGARTIAIAVPATDTAAYPLAPLLESADFALVMLYDQHWAGSEPGPIAAPEWARAALAARVAEAGRQRVIAAFPLYGYRWTGATPAATIGWREADSLARGAGVRLERDPATMTMRARMDEPGVPGQRWELWIADAGLLERLARDARAVGVGRIALWRLGLEDPAVWDGALR